MPRSRRRTTETDHSANLIPEEVYDDTSLDPTNDWLPEGEGTFRFGDAELEIEAGNGQPELPAPIAIEPPQERQKRRFWKRWIPRRNRHAEVAVEIPALGEVGAEETPSPVTNGAYGTKELPATHDLREAPAPNKRKPLWVSFRQLVKKVAKPPSRRKKEKKPKRVRYSKKTRFVQGLLFLAFVVWSLGAIRGFAAGALVHKERDARTATDSRHEGQLKVLGASSTFPLADAIAKADRLAYECFTVPNYGARPTDTDMVTVQNRALANAAIPAGDKVNCGWDGKGGPGKIDDHQVVNDSYWIHDDRATIILQLKLYKRPGFFYYYVPFINSNGVAQFAGMPAIFGTASGALDFVTTCSNPNDSVDIKKLEHTAQLFVNALSGDTSIDLGYLTYGNAKFGGFGIAVSSPKVSQVMYCGSRGAEKRFAALLTFSGPVQGSHYSLPYAFGVVPNAETSGKYQVKEFGPAPGYTGA